MKLTRVKMNTAAKLLANGYETKFHALQIIFVRMSCTTVLSCLYIWYNKVPRPQGVTGLLVLRGSAGFVGLFGLYCELSTNFPKQSTNRSLKIHSRGLNSQTRQ